MVKENFQKIKLLKLWEILQESSENTPLDTVELIERLNNLGISCDRKTLYSDIDLLNKHGYHVQKVRSKRNCYFIKREPFSVPELRILIDAVHAARFITQKKSEELIEKIAKLGSEKEFEDLKYGLYFDAQKYENEQIYENILLLYEAINANKKSSFRYFDYDTQGKIVFRKDGERYLVNPLSLVFNNDNYYLICYLDKYQNLINFRVDRIADVEVDKEKILFADCAKDFDVAECKRKMFSMYTGDEVRVKLEFVSELVEVMMDKFGVDIVINCVNENKCTLSADVHISPVFFGWLATFGEKVKLLSPMSVVKKFTQALKNSLNQYR